MTAFAGDVLLAVFKNLSGGGVLTIDLGTGLVLDSWIAAQVSVCHGHGRPGEKLH